MVQCLVGGVDGLDVWVQVCIRSGGVWPMAASPDVMMDGRECVVCLSSSVFVILLLLLFAGWLPSAVVERVCSRGVSLATELISRAVVLCREKFFNTAEVLDSDQLNLVNYRLINKEAHVSDVFDSSHVIR